MILPEFVLATGKKRTFKLLLRVSTGTTVVNEGIVMLENDITILSEKKTDKQRTCVGVGRAHQRGESGSSCDI